MCPCIFDIRSEQRCDSPVSRQQQIIAITMTTMTTMATMTTITTTIVMTAIAVIIITITIIMTTIIDNEYDPGRTRTCNPRLRRPMPYPLGRGAR